MSVNAFQSLLKKLAKGSQFLLAHWKKTTYTKPWAEVWQPGPAKVDVGVTSYEHLVKFFDPRENRNA
jgi:hypothetical protein